MKLKLTYFEPGTVAILIILMLLLSDSFVIISPFYATGKNAGYRSDTTLMNNIVWRSTARLTWLGNSTHPEIMRSGDGNYNIVWQDDRNGNWDIYYLKVRPDGFKLVNDSRITYFPGDDVNPVIGVKGSHIYIIWQRYVGGHWAIYFARLLYSNRNILIDIPPRSIRSINADCINPRMAVDSQGYIDVVWQEWNSSNWEIMYERLTTYGTPSFSPVDVSDTSTPSMRPQIVVDGNGNSHIFWIEYSSMPGYSIFYRKVEPEGQFLTEPRRISVVSPDTTVDSYFYNDSLYTVFSCSRERLAYEVIFTRLSSSGYTEVDDTNLTLADRIDSIEPHVAVVHHRMFVVCDDYPHGIIRFSIYDEEGRQIGNMMNISLEGSFFPAISVNSKTIGIVWQMNVGNKTFLYFRSAQFPDVKVESLSLYPQGSNITVESNIYSSVSLSVNYAIYLDGNSVFNSSIYFGGTAEIQHIINATPGWHSVEVYFDPFNRIIETNESNNFMVERVYIKHYSFNLTVAPFYGTSAGRWTNISVVVENTGNWEDNYTLKIEYNASLFRVQQSMRYIHLMPGESAHVNFSIYPYTTTIVGNYTLNLTVFSLTSGYAEHKNITLRVYPYVNFKMEYVSIFTQPPGSKIRIPFIVRNTGNCNDTYVIHVSESEHWPMVYGKESLNVSYHSSGFFNITMFIPNGTYGYTRNYVNLTVKSSTLNISMNASVLIVVKPVHAVSAYVVYMMRNGTYYYDVRIKLVNTGNMRDLFNLNLSGDATGYSHLSTSSVLLNPLESTFISLHSYLPPYMAAGSYKLIFHVYYQNRSLTSVPILLTVQENHQFIVSVKKISEGRKIVLSASVRNVGNTPELVEILPKMNKFNVTWNLEHGGKNYTNITTVYVPLNSTVTVNITLKSKLPNGEYKVIILFASASHINRNVSLEFRVGEKSIWEKMADFILGNLTYIIIAVVVIVAVVVYFIRFRE